jgi:hypothetical protein
MLIPKVFNTTPQGGWVYISEFSGMKHGPFYSPDQLLDSVKKHRQANGISIPLGWQYDFWNDYCGQQHADCKENNEVHEDQLVTQIGRALWVELHEYTQNYPDSPTESQQKYAAEWLGHWINRIPRFSKCGCRSSFDKWYAVYPAPFHSGTEFRRWAVIIHDRVNKKLNRPLFDPESAKHPIFEV